MEWLVLYKRVSTGYLFIKEATPVRTFVATTVPRYIFARITPPLTHMCVKVFYTQRVIHDSWARSEDALWMKLNNWGHTSDLATDYFHYWKAINEKNYMFVRNFAPSNPEDWQTLEYVKAKDIDELLHVLREERQSLLKIPKQDTQIVKFLKGCIPPVFGEIRRVTKAYTLMWRT
jgi:hypothetical protein